MSYNVKTYSDEELFSILDVHNPTDRELEARILHLIHKYENMQNKSGNELAQFFNDIYTRFFQVEEEEDDDEDEEEEYEQNQPYQNTLVEGLATMQTARFTYTDASGNTYIPDPALQSITGNAYNENVIDPTTGKPRFSQSVINATLAQQAIDKKTNSTKQYVAPTGNIAQVTSTEAPSTNSIGYTQSFDYSKDTLNPLLKQTIKRIISIDSQYRDNKQAMSTDFTFNLSDPLKDVVSLKLYSVQIPYTWYTINNNYGSNFFYLKGNSPGIDDGYHDFKIDISAGNYSPTDLAVAVNATIGNLKLQNTDLCFGETTVNYTSSTSLMKTIIDISNVYNENSYLLEFSSQPNANDVAGIEPGPGRFANIPAFLGFNYKEYSPYTIRSDYNLLSTPLEDSGVRKYYINDTNNYITIIKYIGPDEYSAGVSTVDLSFTIPLSVTGGCTRNELFNDLNYQLQKSKYLTSDSQISRHTVNASYAIGNGFDYYLLVLKPNRKTTNNTSDSKMIVIFPTESIYSTYQPIWIGSSSCFRFQYNNNELNTIISETPPIKQQSANYIVNSNPYIYLRCITPGFDVSGYNTSGNGTLVFPPYTGLGPGNNISRNEDGSYLPGPDLSSNDYIIEIPNSTVIGYTINDYITVINSALSTTSKKTATQNDNDGDINTTYSTAFLDATSRFNLRLDMNKTFNQNYYSISLANSYLSSVLNLSTLYKDLSSSNVFTSSFPLLATYTISGEFLATVSPRTDIGYGNRKGGIYQVPVPPDTANTTYYSYQDLQQAINTQFQTYKDPIDNTAVLAGTTVSFNYNFSTKVIDCNFTVTVNKYLTEKDYSIQFFDPSMTYYKNYYDATQNLDRESIYTIDNHNTTSFYKDLASCYDANPILFSTSKTISSSMVYDICGVVDPLLIFTDASLAYTNNDISSRTIDTSSVYLLPSKYYTSISGCFEDSTNAELFSTFTKVSKSNIIYSGPSMEYYVANPTSVQGYIYGYNNQKTTIFLTDNSSNYYYDAVTDSYYVDPSMIRITGLTKFYLTDSVYGNTLYDAETIYAIDSSSVTYNDISNVYLFNTAANYFNDTNKDKYFVNTIDITAISQKSVFVVNPTDSSISSNKLFSTNHIYRIDASSVYTVDSTKTTKTIQLTDPSTIYVIDSSRNYYYNNTTMQYTIDPSLIVYNSNDKPVYVLTNNYVHKITSTHSNYQIYGVDSQSVIYSDIQDIFMIDSSLNIYIDMSTNLSTDPADFLYKINPDTKQLQDTSSVYFIKSPTKNTSLNININKPLSKPEIIRVDASNIYLVDTPLDYWWSPHYDSTNWYNFLNVDQSFISQETKLVDLSVPNQSYSLLTSKEPINIYKITLTNSNNTFTFNATGDGVYSDTGANNMTVTVPIGTYTRSDLLVALNTAIQNTTPTDASGSFISIYADPVTQTEYTKIRVNINKIYSAADYRISYYDPYSFVKCYAGATSIQNTTWDTTLGWILGYRANTVYALSDYGGKYQVISITGDTGVSTNLYNYFMICLDDYNQNHLNDGLVTITTKDVNIALPSYANRSHIQCDPVTGKKTYNTSSTTDYSKLTQNQIYSLTEIANAKSQSTTTTTTTGNTVSSTSYGLGPFVQDVFGLIPMKVNGLANGASYIEFGGSLQDQNRTYFGPVNIHRMSVKLVSDRGDVIDLNGANWSFSLVCEQLYKSNNPGSK